MEILSLERFKGLVSILQNEYDLILIDTPPILMVADAIVIGKNTDGVIFVNSFHNSNEETLRSAIDLLSKNEIPLIGLVLNRAYNIKHNFGYGYSYEYEKPEDGEE
ncbi:tyrosine-protein kinase family protein [Lewinella sp. LCG006]|uniref:tyrosine-protein kinase family protein n=1 Tax=Lewinella sp. LCG006 TaxID=3231911 RepID=UPI00345F1BE1